MIDPQVLHGGASSWFFIAANEDLVARDSAAGWATSATDGGATLTLAPVRLKPDTTPSEPESALAP